MLKLTPQQYAPILISLQTAQASGGSEQRKFTRSNIETQLTLMMLKDNQLGSRMTVLTRDISVTGVGLTQHAQFKPQETFVICFPAGKQRTYIVCSATFCRPLADGVFKVGAQFESLAEPAVIEQFEKVRAAA